jgi:hypothetical protein
LTNSRKINAFVILDKYKHKLVRNGLWALLLLALYQGHSRAAYLPVAGPAPLRFLPTPSSASPARKVQLPPTTAPPTERLFSTTSLVLTPEFWNNLVPGVWPSGQPNPNATVSVIPPTQGVLYPQQAPGEPTIYLQNLVPFFIPDGSTTNVSPGTLVLPVDFVPPANLNRPSSSATYINR